MARDMLLTGEAVPAEMAHRWGLISRLVDDPIAEAERLATRVASYSPQAIAATKELALASSSDDFDNGLQAEHMRWMDVRRTANAQEGLTAFAQKRLPRFSRIHG